MSRLTITSSREWYAIYISQTQEEREILEKYEEAKQKKGKKEEEKVEEKTKLHSKMCDVLV